MSLTAEQLAAVCATGSTVAISAGAGTGKTRVLVERVVRMVQQGIDPAAIMVCTFTEAAAEEISDRLHERDCRGVFAGTLHGWAWRLIVANAVHFGLTENFGIYDAIDAAALLDSARRDLGRKGTDGAVRALYASRLVESNAIDYDGLLVKAAELLRDYPEPAALARAGARHIIGDEAQDFDLQQWELLRTLQPETLTMCADWRQAIYEWRKARPDLFKTFYEEAGARFDLTHNFRSGPGIVAVANDLLGSTMVGRPASDPGPTVHLALDHQCAPVAAVVDAVRRALTLGYRHEEIVVLGRSWSSLRRASDELVHEGVPVAWGGVTKDLWCEQTGRCLAAWVRLQINPSDNNLAAMVIDRTTPPGEVAGAAWRAEASDHKRSVLKHAIVRGRLPPRAPLKSFTADVVDAFLHHNATCGYLTVPLHAPTLAKLLPTLKHANRRTMRQFRRWWMFGRGDDRKPEEDGVLVTTVHGFKGREAKVVIGVDIDSRTFEGTPKRPTEDQRILYVLVTRAQEHLVLIRRAEVDASSYLPPSAGTWRDECDL